ncbi:MAG: 50S ribosomal protein L12 [Nanoarchaeota archaeon]
MEYIYGALLLHKLGKPVDETHLKKVIEAAGAHVDDAKVKTLIASLHGVDIAAELANAQIAVAAPVAGGHAEAKAEEKHEEKKAEESAAGLASLFG